MASLGNDLASIRKEKNLSLDDIHEATKLPKHIISAIEDDSIFSDYEENATYIRSYIRGYAKALSINERDIIYALDKQAKGSYAGSLIKNSEGPPKRTFEYDQEIDSDDSSEREQSEPDEKEPPEEAPEPVAEEKQEATPPPKTSEVSKKPPEVKSVDWVDMGRRFQPLQSPKPKIWLGAIAILIIAVLGIAYYFYQSTPDSDTQSGNAVSSAQQTQDNSESPDSLQLNLMPSADQDSVQLAGSNSDTTQTQQLQTQALDALPDTLSMIVYAAYGKLEPVRVYTDIMDNINPYWIEQGSALRFDFVNEVRIRGQFSRMVLMMNGHLIQNFREQFFNPETRLVEIHRSFFENDPKWLEPAPDSLGIDAPPPSVIKTRPTFN